jgi:hypothetical protein
MDVTTLLQQRAQGTVKRWISEVTTQIVNVVFPHPGRAPGGIHNGPGAVVSHGAGFEPVTERLGNRRFEPKRRSAGRLANPAQSAGSDTTDPSNESLPIQELQVVVIDHR